MLKSGQVIGLPVTVGSTDRVAAAILRKAETGQGGYVCVSNVHMLTTAKQNKALQKTIENAAWVTADGLPLVWVLKWKGFKETERVTGTDLTLKLCERSAEEGMPVGFYGGTPETVSALQKSIASRFPALKVPLYESPPMLPAQPEVYPAVVERLNKSGAKIIFVGLGCPKQEFWMAAYRPHLSAVLIGIGAAFDFLGGTVKRAPPWVQRAGLEWLHRLASDPAKMWKRYATTNPVFIWIVMKEYFKKKVTGSDNHAA